MERQKSPNPKDISREQISVLSINNSVMRATPKFTQKTTLSNPSQRVKNNNNSSSTGQKNNPAHVMSPKSLSNAKIIQNSIKVKTIEAINQKP